MEPLPLRKIVELIEGRWTAPYPPPEILVTEVSTDSRSLPESSVFAALRGDRFDGHAFVEEARRKGAVASIVSGGKVAQLPALGGPFICVDDPLTALERLARWNRDRLKMQVVGITGSVGKTSTKEFLATILADAFLVKSAPKSFNNRLGVATTMISAGPDTEVLVAELGTSGPGELTHISGLARPHRIVITEIAPAHLAGFGGMDDLVAAKAEIFDGLVPGGTAFLRHGMYGFDRFVARAKGPVATFGWHEGDFAVTAWERVRLGRDSRNAPESGDHGYLFTLNRSENFLLPVPGRHNVLNATAAIAVARDLGMSWEQLRSSLANCRLPPLRLQIREEGGIVFMDDTYNANPLSMQAAIEEWLLMVNGSSPFNGGAADRGSHLVAVLGDMLEMGDQSRALHETIGTTLSTTHARLVVTVGSDSRWIGDACRAGGGDSEIAHFGSAAEAIPFLKERLRVGDRVLLKASRRVGLDTAATELRKWFATQGPSRS